MVRGADEDGKGHKMKLLHEGGSDHENSLVRILFFIR